MVEKDRWGTIIISQEELIDLWIRNHVAEKRQRGDLVEVEGYSSGAGDPDLSGIRAVFVKLRTVSGQHIGTVHEFYRSDGSFWHSHPHDYVDRECQKFKRPDKPPYQPT